MNEEPKDIKSIFAEAIEKKSSEERASFLDKACAGDDDVRAQVEALLKAHKEAGDFLEEPAIGANVTLGDPHLTEGPGTIISRYKLLEKIGEGGMACVYMAEQKEPIRRKVALKIIKLGMDTKQVIARFEAERQALAIMDHPNVAKVFDAGATETGRPYFVMELVKGVSITEYCDKNKLSTKERLDLFVQVCNAVQHAHQKGIIHRDIKPSNVMVTMHDDKAVPKVIDFGIAKATGQKLTEKTLFTRYAQMIGTPEYMSPEQAQFSGLDIDTRTDIYSLGVLLYALLTGTTPFEAEELRSKGYGEIQRIIQETEPPKPSTKLSTMGDALTGVAEHRKTDPDLLAKLVRGDLDWIVMKTLEKDRTRRYETANALAADIKRHFDNEPVEAGPPSATYRLRKFVQKHRRTVAAVAAIAAVLVVGLVVSTAMYFQAEQAREKESVARSQAEQARTAEAKQRKLAEQQAEAHRRTLYLTHFSMAKEAYSEGNIRRVRELLESCSADLRGWEWYRLNHLSDQSVMTLRGHDGAIYWVAFSPDGKRIFSCSDDNITKVWDAASGVELMTLRGPDGAEGPSAYSPDVERIISGNKDGTIWIWDPATGAELVTLRGHSDEVYLVTFSPDGKRIVSSSYDHTVRVWDGSTGAELMIIRGHEDKVGPVLFSPDGKRIVSGSYDKTIKVWDAATGAELMTLRGHKGEVWGLAFSPDGERIVSGSGDNTIKVWDAATGTELMTLLGHEGAVYSVSFSPDGRHIVSGGEDKTIKVWDAATGAELMTLHGHEGAVGAVFSPDGKRIVSGSKDKTIKVWDAAIRGDVVTLSGHRDKRGNNHVLSIAFSPDGKRIVSGSLDRTVKLWDAATGAEPMTLRGHQGMVLSAAFSPDGKRIVSGSMDNTVKVWDAGTGTELMTLVGHGDGVSSVAFSPDGRLISGSYDKTIKVWDAETGAELMTLPGHEDWVSHVAFSPDGKRIVSGSHDKTIKIWDAATGAELMTLRGHEGEVWSVSFSPDGERIVSGSLDKTIKVWDAANGAELMTLRAVSYWPNPIAFSPDGKRIISGGLAGTVKVWDSATGAELMTLRVVGNWPSSIAFSPDGKTIAAGIWDNSIKLWESTTPAGGYELRWNAEATRKVVDELYEKLGFYSEVIDKLNADKTLAEPVRKVALQIANYRLWEDARKLEEESWDVVISAGGEIEAYRLALGKAEMANRLEPNDRIILAMLGIAQYRVGAYQDALNTLTRVEKMWENINQAIFAKFAFIAKAMAAHKLGQYEHAEVALGRVRDLRKDKRFTESANKRAQAFLTFLEEAEKLLSSRKE